MVFAMRLVSMLALLEASATAFDPNLKFNLTVPDTSGLIIYFEDVYLNNSVSWHTVFSDVSGTYVKGMIGYGTSKHVSFNGATAAAMTSVVGTGLWWKGFIYNPTNETTPTGLRVNGSDLTYNIPTSTGPVFIGQGNMPYAFYESYWYPFDNASTVTIESLTLELGISSDKSSFDQVPSTTQMFVNGDGALNEFYTNVNHSNWTAYSDITNVLGEANTKYSQLMGTSGARIQMTVPANTSFVMVNGTSCATCGITRMIWDPPLPGWTHKLGVEALMWNPYWVLDSIVHVASLDPTVQYTLDIMGETDPQFHVDDISLRSTTFWSGPGASNSTTGGGGSSSNAGIIGGVVGGVVGALLLAAGGFFFWRRNKKNKQKNKTQPGFEIEDQGTAFIPSPTVTPFNNQPRKPSAACFHTNCSVMAQTTGSGYPSSGANYGPQGYMPGPGSPGTGYEGPAMAAGGFAAGAAGVAGIAKAREHAAEGHRLSAGGVSSSSGYYDSEDFNGGSSIGGGSAVPMLSPASIHSDMVYNQHQDAGALSRPLPNPEEIQVPPSYDPTWSPQLSGSSAPHNIDQFSEAGQSSVSGAHLPPGADYPADVKSPRGPQ